MQPLKALLCQLLAYIVVAWNSAWLAQWISGTGWLVWIQSVLAALFSSLLRQPRWWWPIHLLFMPTAWILMQYHLPSWLYCLAFGLLILIFWGTVKGDVPLFLSSSTVTDALFAIVNREQADNLIELGAGVGSVVVPLARRLPRLRITAVENAPLPWLILNWRCRHLANVRVVGKNLWTYSLADFTLAFAFLSPKVMSRIGAKCRREMPGGGLLISSSFDVPDWESEAVIDVCGTHQTRLYCYRCAGKA